MQQVAYYEHDTGENILWHPQKNALYWLDIPAGKMFCGYFPSSEKQDEQLENFQSSCILQMDEAIGGFVFRKTTASHKACFLLFGTKGRIYEWAYDHGCEQQAKPQLYFQVDPDLVPSRFNDVFALPAVAAEYVLCGTMPSDGSADSRLLLFDVVRRHVTVVQQNLKLSNGMGLSPQCDFLYLADTRDFVVYRFAVDNLERAEINWKSRMKWIDFQGRLGRPDGLCVDEEGRIWVAETGAGVVSCFAAEGQELGQLEIGTPKITSCCFGGSMRQILFVSTQGGQESQDKGGKAGGIFALNFGSDNDCGNYMALRQKVGKYFKGQEEALV